ncbi:MAG: PilZ domain-containing protein [Marinobacter sp.]|nr:PilZ domain-containing protein [Marinobacter sp.]
MKSPSSTRPNLRDQQRVEASLAVTVEQASGNVIDCQTTNLSRAGMMIACTGEIVNQLAPGKRSPAAGEGIPVSTRFSLPVIAAQSVAVKARCQIVNIRRIARDTFHVGIQFCDFEGNGYQYVDQYVSRQLNPSA